MSRDFKKKIRKFWNENYTIIIFVSLVLFSIFLILVIANLLFPSAEKETPDDGNSLTNTEKIDIKVDKGTMNPNEITLKAGRFYDFNFTKTNQSNCSGLEIKNLNIRIDFQEINKTFPLRINSEGDYQLKCFGEENELKIKVETTN